MDFPHTIQLENNPIQSLYQYYALFETALSDLRQITQKPRLLAGRHLAAVHAAASVLQLQIERVANNFGYDIIRNTCAKWTDAVPDNPAVPRLVDFKRAHLSLSTLKSELKSASHKPFWSQTRPAIMSVANQTDIVLTDLSMRLKLQSPDGLYVIQAKHREAAAPTYVKDAYAIAPLTSYSPNFAAVYTRKDNADYVMTQMAKHIPDRNLSVVPFYQAGKYKDLDCRPIIWLNGDMGVNSVYTDTPPYDAEKHYAVILQSI